MNKLNEFFEVSSIEVNGEQRLQSIITNIGGDDIKIVAIFHEKRNPEDFNQIGMGLLNKSSCFYDIDIDLWLNGSLVADLDLIGPYLFVVENNEISLTRVHGLVRSIYTDLKLRILKIHPQEPGKQNLIQAFVRALERTGKIMDHNKIMSSFGVTKNGLCYKRSLTYHNGRCLYKTRWFKDDIPVAAELVDQYGISTDFSIKQEEVQDTDIMPDEVAEKLMKELYH